MPQNDESWPRDALPRGADLHGYEIETILGRGGFGITYRARDKLDQVFAVKECFPKQFAVRQGLEVLPTDTGDADVLQECLERFLREAKALIRLSRLGAAGDGVVKVATFFEAHGTAYIVMEYLAGQSLEGLLKANPSGIPAERLADIMRRLLHALGCVHDAGLLHRDVKPSNISLREDGRPVLIDFGATRGATANHTVTYTKIFSESYSPIEQFSGGEQGPCSDIYALGMTCYRAIGGTAIDAFTRQQALLRGKPDPLPAAGKIGAGRYPAALLAAIDAALAVSPADRPQSVGELLALLDGDEEQATVVIRAPTAMPAAADARFSEVLPAVVPPARPELHTIAQLSAPNPGSRRWLLAAGAVVFLVALGGVAALVMRQHQVAVQQAGAAAAQKAAAAQAAAAQLAAAQKTAADKASADQALAAAAQKAAAEAAAAEAPEEATAGLSHEMARGNVAYRHGRYLEAMTWYQRAAASGDAKAQEKIGFLYAHGLGVAPDYAQAMKWYQMSAAQADPVALNNIGILYARGLGVTKDCATAHAWFEKAAAVGSAAARDWLRPNSDCSWQS